MTDDGVGPTFGPGDMAEIRFPESGPGVSFRLLQDFVVPRPVFLLSTISGSGVANVAPYSYVCPAATTPAALVLSFLRREDGTEKDTMLNLRETGEVVVNAVTEAIVEQANACAENVPPNRSEFDLTGLTPIYLTSRAPHVMQSPVRLECRLESETALGGTGPGAATIAIVSVARAYVARPMYRGEGQLEVEALRLVGRSSVDKYLVADGQFTLARPDTGEGVA